MKVIIVIVAFVIFLVLYHKSQKEEPRVTRVSREPKITTPKSSISRRFKIAGLSHRCTRKDIGIVMGKVGYDPTNEYDPNAIAIIANIEQPNEKLLGFIPRESQATFANFAYKQQELPFIGFIEEFTNDEGRKMLFGKIKAYTGTDESIEAEMSNDLKLLTIAFAEKDYNKRIEMLDIW